MNRIIFKGSKRLRLDTTSRISGVAHKSTNSGFSAAISAGEKLVSPKVPLENPLSIVSNEMSTLAKNIASLIGSGHSTLNRAAAYYFESDSKKLRPLLVLLLSKALNEIPSEQRNRLKPDYFDTTDQPEYRGCNSSIQQITKGSPNDSLSPLNILHGINPSLILAPLSSPFQKLPEEKTPDNNGILPKQRRLAEIVELIHTASLLHDDVIDHSDKRRGRESGNVAFTNKMAVLAGDFLLGRASVAIARLRNPEVIELISTSIANLVEGEFMQLKNTISNRNPNALESGKSIPIPSGKVPNPVHEYSVQLSEEDAAIHEKHVDAAFQYYLHKTYLKTAALISKSCRSTAVLSCAQEDIIENCYQFGRNLGISFQLVDDILDYTRTSDELGKPAGADLELGLATAPVLYAWKKNPELGPIIARKFSEKGDIEYAVKNVEKYNGLQQTRELAEEYKLKAIENLKCLPPSDARAALEFLANTVTTRGK